MAAKKQSEASKGSNKIRVVMIEADLTDGNISEIAQAITHALKPQSPQIRYISNGQQKTLNGIPEILTPVDEEEEILEEDAADATLAPPVPKTQRSARPKKTKPPEYSPDLIADIDGFKKFADEKAPDSKNQQYLVAAYWLKEHGNSPTVTADKIYTCYKTANWSAGFNDWSQTFHNLVHAEYMRKVGKGEFAINPTGEHLVKKGNG